MESRWQPSAREAQQKWMMGIVQRGPYDKLKFLPFLLVNNLRSCMIYVHHL